MEAHCSGSEDNKEILSYLDTTFKELSSTERVGEKYAVENPWVATKKELVDEHLVAEEQKDEELLEEEEEVLDEKLEKKDRMSNEELGDEQLMVEDPLSMEQKAEQTNAADDEHLSASVGKNIKSLFG